LQNVKRALDTGVSGVPWGTALVKVSRVLVPGTTL
jgi:hypothetical protein